MNKARMQRRPTAEGPSCAAPEVKDRNVFTDIVLDDAVNLVTDTDTEIVESEPRK